MAAISPPVPVWNGSQNAPANQGLRCGRAPGNFHRVSALPETPFAEYWPDAYRFAFLMTGSAAAAETAIQAVVPGAAERLTQMRDQRQAKRWLFSKVLEICRCIPAAPACSGGPAENAARLFSGLPEAERSALSLFYLHRFQADELAEVLEVTPLALGRLLGSARLLLARATGN